MKKFLAIFSLVILTSSISFAEPFLTCDPQPEASKFRIRLSINGTDNPTEWVVSDPVNNSMLFDLVDIPPGDYLGEAQAGAITTVTNEQGEVSTVERWSDSSPFVLQIRSGKKPAKVKAIR